ASAVNWCHHRINRSIGIRINFNEKKKRKQRRFVMLTVHNVSGGYINHPVIKEVDFSVKKGEFFGILGPNGSGKTTLLKMISGLLPCTRGSIEIAGKKITQVSRKELAQTIAVLPQIPGQTFPYTARETVALGRYARLRGLFQTWRTSDEEIL